MAFKTISVIGLGYIGLPTAAIFAASGKNVIGVDIDRKVIDTINRGEIHIAEPGLDLIVKDTVNSGKFKAVETPVASDAFLIAVPTPFYPREARNDIPKPNLEYIKAAALSISPVLKKGDLIVLESTSPVGTTKKLSKWLENERSDLTFPQTHGEDSDIRISHCPERVLPGRIMKELVENDRLIGGITKKCADFTINLYKSFVKGECVVTDSCTAEMAKLTENSCRDMQIAFANELSVMCDKLNIDVWELISLANRHPRVNILQPGPGVGGHCIAVDPWFLVSQMPDKSKLIHTARLVNDSKPDWVISKASESINKFLKKNPQKSLKDVTVACYGLTFKPNIDDLRESPALEITNKIAKKYDCKVIAVEPNISLDEKVSKHFKLNKIDQAIKEADIHLLLVDHSDFYNISPPGQYVIDTKGIWTNKK
tara:strand:- start:35670 stop:36950 length:1281 start_codon:yes stop_codon:yes gene_type:complete